MKLVPTSNCCKGSRLLTDPASIPGELVASLRNRSAASSMTIVLLPSHATRQANQPSRKFQTLSAHFKPQCLKLEEAAYFCLRHAVLTPAHAKPARAGDPGQATQQLRHLTKPVGEQSTGACIGTHYPRLPFASRLRLRRRGCVDPAELPLCAALFRGGSISRHPPPTENLVREQSD